MTNDDGAALAAAAGLQALAKSPRLPVLFLGHGSPMNTLERNGFTPLLTFGPSRLGRPPAGTMAYLDVVHSNSLNLAGSHHFASCHLAQTHPLDERP